jgi:hypothetical protein
MRVSGDVEALAWNDERLAAAESAKCTCGHATLDHAWHGCENCACARSAVHAFITSDWLAAERDRAVREALAPVLAVHWRYFDDEGTPGTDDTTPEPEDVWRYDRDFRAALPDYREGEDA